MKFAIECEQEKDGRWLAEVIGLPGVLVYGQTPEEAMTKVQALALRVLADRLEDGESAPALIDISFSTAVAGGNHEEFLYNRGGARP